MAEQRGQVGATAPAGACLRRHEARRLLAGPVAEVAPRLLGARLRHGAVTVRITEVEAYGGADDAASHAFRGRTARNAAMFGEAGLLYCYFVYGMHHCCNVVTGSRGEGAAVLLRAGQVVRGEDLARSRRDGASARDLARGPARLSRALGLDRGHDGTDLLALTAEPELWLGPPLDSTQIDRGPRVGVRAGVDTRQRFWITGAPSVSRYRPARPRHPR